MNNESRKQIRDSVHLLLQLVRVEVPPIPVEKIARLRGAQIRFEPYAGNISGLLYRDGKQTIVGVNKLHPKTRQRFTIAHEIGHLELHGSKVFLDRDFRIDLRSKKSAEATDINEIQANAFAAELLMPQEMLMRDAKGHQLDYEDDVEIRKLADRYEVSLQAMILRLTKLGLIKQEDDSEI